MAKAETFDKLVRRLTQDETWEEFAERCGVSSRQLLNLRNGVGKRMPTKGTLTLLAKALGVDIDTVRKAIEAGR